METKKLVPDSSHDDGEPEAVAWQQRDYGGTRQLGQQIFGKPKSGKCV